MAKQPKKSGDFVCKVPNIWTSKGKMVEGEKDTFDAKELAALNEAQDHMLKGVK